MPATARGRGSSWADLVNLSFTAAVVVGVERWKGGCAITVQTASDRFSVEVDAIDAMVVKVGSKPDS